MCNGIHWLGSELALLGTAQTDRFLTSLVPTHCKLVTRLRTAMFHLQSSATVASDQQDLTTEASFSSNGTTDMHVVTPRLRLLPFLAKNPGA